MDWRNSQGLPHPLGSSAARPNHTPVQGWFRIQAPSWHTKPDSVHRVRHGCGDQGDSAQPGDDRPQSLSFLPRTHWARAVVVSSQPQFPTFATTALGWVTSEPAHCTGSSAYSLCTVHHPSGFAAVRFSELRRGGDRGLGPHSKSGAAPFSVCLFFTLGIGRRHAFAAKNIKPRRNEKHLGTICRVLAPYPLAAPILGVDQLVCRWPCPAQYPKPFSRGEVSSSLCTQDSLLCDTHRSVAQIRPQHSRRNGWEPSVASPDGHTGSKKTEQVLGEGPEMGARGTRAEGSGVNPPCWQLLQALVLAGWQTWGVPSGPWWTAVRWRLQGATQDQDLDRASGTGVCHSPQAVRGGGPTFGGGAAIQAEELQPELKCLRETSELTQRAVLVRCPSGFWSGYLLPRQPPGHLPGHSPSTTLFTRQMRSMTRRLMASQGLLGPLATVEATMGAKDRMITAPSNTWGGRGAQCPGPP